MKLKPFNFFLLHCEFQIAEILRQSNVPDDVSQRLRNRLLVFAVETNLQWADQRHERIAQCQTSVRTKAADLQTQLQALLANSELPENLRTIAQRALDQIN